MHLPIGHIEHEVLNAAELFILHIKDTVADNTGNTR